MTVVATRPSAEIKKPVPSLVGEPFSSSATISTTAGFALLTISGVVSAHFVNCHSSKHAVTLIHKYDVGSSRYIPPFQDVLPSSVSAIQGMPETKITNKYDESSDFEEAWFFVRSAQGAKNWHDRLLDDEIFRPSTPFRN
jgi:hypothetical protein